MTYLLGVGDRHLDNLLLAPDGTYDYQRLYATFVDGTSSRSFLPRSDAF